MLAKKCCQCSIEFSTPGIVCTECREKRVPKWREAEPSINIKQVVAKNFPLSVRDINEYEEREARRKELNRKK